MHVFTRRDQKNLQKNSIHAHNRHFLGFLGYSSKLKNFFEIFDAIYEFFMRVSTIKDQKSF